MIKVFGKPMKGFVNFDYGSVLKDYIYVRVAGIEREREVSPGIRRGGGRPNIS